MSFSTPSAGASGAVTSVFGRTGSVVATNTDYSSVGLSATSLSGTYNIGGTPSLTASLANGQADGTGDFGTATTRFGTSHFKTYQITGYVVDTLLQQYSNFDSSGDNFAAFTPVSGNNGLFLGLAPAGTSNTAQLLIARITGSNSELMLVGSELGASSTFDIQVKANGTGTLRVFHFLMGATISWGVTTTNSIFQAQKPLQIGGSADTENTNNQISTASQGAGSTQLFIGNASINVTSDARLKNVIGPSTLSALDIVKKLPIVRFTWDDPSDTAQVNRNTRGTWEFGGVAQDWIKYVPWLVDAPERTCKTCLQGKRCRKHKHSDGPWRIDYAYAVPLLVKAIQELNAKLGVRK